MMHYAMMAYDVLQGEDIYQEQQGSQDRTLRDTNG